MEIEQLKCFVEVCKNKSFTDAAEVLYLSQPTISKKIHSLETELGVTLINRHKNNVMPTVAGEYLMAQAKKIIKLSEEAIQHTKVIGSGKIGSLYVGVSDQLDINGIMPGFLKEFVDSEPLIDLQLSIHPHSVMPQYVQNGALDISFLPNAGDALIFTGLERIEINRACPRLYFSSQHRKANRPNLSVEDFLDDTLYTIGSTSSETQKQIKSAGFNFKNVVYVNSMQVLKLYIEANLGVTVLGVSQSFGSSDRISSISLPFNSYRVGTDCIYNISSENSSVPVFISALKKYLKLE